MILYNRQYDTITGALQPQLLKNQIKCDHLIDIYVPHIRLGTVRFFLSVNSKELHRRRSETAASRHGHERPLPWKSMICD